MRIDLINLNGIYIAELISENLEINNSQDALDIMANCSSQGARNIIIHEINILRDFFDLKTGIAGEILQKFSTYNFKLAIVGDFSKYSSKSLRDFIYESNKTGRINFVNSVNQAKEVLIKNEI
ncbi:MAG: DUF4180 domain-containing protein [Ignavibacteriae bacterium]|nr:MAG: DUF4180 domain-containing protein [Ignavibacteriota bacterium]